MRSKTEPAFNRVAIYSLRIATQDAVSEPPRSERTFATSVPVSVPLLNLRAVCDRVFGDWLRMIIMTAATSSGATTDCISDRC